MAPLLELLLIFLCVSAATSEVNDNFDNCQQFFYKGTPPDVFFRQEVSPRSICQVYSDSYHFATLYSTRYRIPIFSAYRLPLETCPRNQQKRRDSWFIEPQLLGNGEPHNMNTPGSRKDEYKIKQAINDDYRNTGFDRGHLNPNFYHCNNGRTATFTLTNAVPQNACFNEQIWYAMESKSRDIMKALCSFGGAKRFFVTGTIPGRRTIPNAEHDQEGDRIREYNRVSVPTHMWTAACCDSTGATNPADKDKGFSFGYLGRNAADGSVNASSVRELENSLSSIPPAETRRFKIFYDHCNENSIKSKDALQKIKFATYRSIINSQDILRFTDLSSLPPKKRPFSDIESLPQGGNVLFDLSLSVEFANRYHAVNTYRNQLKSSSIFTVMLISFNYVKMTSGGIELDANAKSKLNIHENQVLTTTRNKHTFNSGYKKNRASSGAKNRYKTFSLGKQVDKFVNSDAMNRVSLDKRQSMPKNKYMHVLNEKHGESSNRPSADLYMMHSKKEEKDTADPVTTTDRYLIVPKLSAADITIGGDHCRSDHKCDYHGETYKWCYWSETKWNYCCVSDCKVSNGSPIPTCDVGGGYKRTCSMRSSVVTVKGGKCRQDHECGVHNDYGYYWCYTDFDGNWDYCCQPWHRCGYNDETYKWCYVSLTLKSKWMHCNY